MNTMIVETLKNTAKDIITFFSGQGVYRKKYFVGYLDHFAVASADLTNEHKQLLDTWLDGRYVEQFPLSHDTPEHLIELIYGLTSQTGAPAFNDNLGKERANNVYDYLSNRLPAAKFLAGPESVGMSKPRIDVPGIETGENRAVGIIMSCPVPIISARPIQTPEPTPPSPEHSKEWGFKIDYQAGLSVPIIEVVGVSLISGKIKNFRTGEVRDCSILSGGAGLGLSLSFPVTYSTGLGTQTYTRFISHWETFDTLRRTPVHLTWVTVGDVVTVSKLIIGFVERAAIIEISGPNFEATLGELTGTMHYGIFNVKE